MKRLFVRRLLTLLLLLATWLGAGAAEQGQAGTPPPDDEQGTAVATPHDGPQGEALITDATGMLRLCNTRPQRLLPTLGAKPQKGSGRTALPHRESHQPFYPLHARQVALAPLHLVASCRYYVIALRHIIR